MLFNSPIFIFVFLPIVWVGFIVIGKSPWSRARFHWLVIASLFFYGWWRAEFLWLLLASVLFNYGVGCWLTILAEDWRKKCLLAVGVAANLSAIAYFKYAGFFVGNITTLLDVEWRLPPIVLPLAISFFTFQQIAYLVDAFGGKTREYDLVDYLLFVTFFPQFIAGPIVHHADLLPQFKRQRHDLVTDKELAAGLSLFVIGLAKKVLIADRMAEFATPVFTGLEAGQTVTMVDAWAGALSYSFQLYFDFSGYSDMALGLALLFGLRLPLNFDSPYKAVNLIDFWRRWHMTLSRFLRDYLYFALGGNRKGPVRRYGNLMLTMLLGGLWHGAAWNYVVWGGMHGVGLAFNHGWRSLRPRSPSARGRSSTTGIWASRALTFLFVVVAWVFFRSSSTNSAMQMLSIMFGFDNWSFESTYTSRRYLVAWISILMAVVWLMPNSQEWLGRARAALWSPRPDNGTHLGLLSRIRWAPNPFWAVVLALLFVFVILNLSRVSEFIYYQF